MTTDELKAILDRVLTWPAEPQEDVVEVLRAIEEQDKSPYQLTEEQVAEVRRRQAVKEPRTLTLSEFDKRLRRFGV